MIFIVFSVAVLYLPLNVVECTLQKLHFYKTKTVEPFSV